MLYDKRWDEAKPAVTDEPWRDVLRRAADLVEQRGLAKFVQEDERGRVCLHGAISIAMSGKTGMTNGSCPAEEAIYRHLKSTGARGLIAYGITSDFDCSGWNNARTRTKDEVVAALRAAAEWREPHAV